MRALASIVLALAVVAAAGLIPACSCSNTNGGHHDLAVGDLAMPDLSAVVHDLAGTAGDMAGCFGAGATCSSGAQCCSMMCDPQSNVCINTMCGNAGAACASAADCCGLACDNHKCGGQCVSDNMPCTTSGECCSTICGSNGMCTPLNTMCKTAGNECLLGSECCNGLCVGANANDAGTMGQCASPSQVSFCTQVGDICTGDAQCCTGVCNLAAGQTVGTCAQIATSCSVDGETCNGCGGCCSHFCGPFGTSGSSICQPASGCHVQGDICKTTKDCCGGDPNSGLPGAGQVVCTPDPTYPTKIGVCSGPNKSNCPNPGSPTCTNTCDPAGDICHMNPSPICAGGTTNVRNDCCACINTKTCCQPDKSGIPRCNLVGNCVPQGGACSFSADCCGGLPCVPDAMGNLHCGAAPSGCGGPCTTNSDCATGLLCYTPPGSIQGACNGASCTPPVPDGGTPPDLASSDLAGPQPDLATCAQYGQACSTTVPCCNGVTCLRPATIGGPCLAGDTDCTCYNLLP